MDNNAKKLQPVGAPGRALHTFDFPEDFHPDWQSITLCELTAREQLEAAKRTKDTGLRLGHELIKQSIWDVNGERVSLGDGTLDRAWNSMPPAVLDLVMAGYAKINSATEEQQAGFLKSRRVRV